MSLSNSIDLIEIVIELKTGKRIELKNPANAIAENQEIERTSTMSSHRRKIEHPSFRATLIM
jgi:hypothetical protein